MEIKIGYNSNNKIFPYRVQYVGPPSPLLSRQCGGRVQEFSGVDYNALLVSMIDALRDDPTVHSYEIKATFHPEITPEQQSLTNVVLEAYRQRDENKLTQIQESLMNTIFHRKNPIIVNENTVKDIECLLGPRT